MQKFCSVLQAHKSDRELQIITRRKVKECQKITLLRHLMQRQTHALNLSQCPPTPVQENIALHSPVAAAFYNSIMMTHSHQEKKQNAFSIFCTRRQGSHYDFQVFLSTHTLLLLSAATATTESTQTEDREVYKPLSGNFLFCFVLGDVSALLQLYVIESMDVPLRLSLTQSLLIL